jgi:hypothetical protein
LYRAPGWNAQIAADFAVVCASTGEGDVDPEADHEQAERNQNRAEREAGSTGARLELYMLQT